MSTCGYDVETMEISHKVDGITNLPNCVTANILSRLPAVQAMRTCVLSREWKYKWTSIIPNMYVNDESLHGEHRIANFYNFVNKLVECSPELSIRSFFLYLGHESHDALSDHLMEWISKVSRRGVKNLVIIAPGAEEGKTVMSTNCVERDLSLLTELVLQLDCSLKFPLESCFPNLKRLCLSGGFGQMIILNEHTPVTGQLLLLFPVLEDFELRNYEFKNVNLVEINAPELIRFKAYCVSWIQKNPKNYVIKISAPKVEWFESVEGPAYEFSLRTPFLYHLALEDEISPSEVLASQVLALLNGAPNLKCLHLSGGIIEALARWNRFCYLPTFDQLKELKLLNAGAIEVQNFLQAAPFLESLSLLIKGENYEQLKEPLPNGIVSQLKQVELIEFHGKWWQIDMAKLFLDKGKTEKLKMLFINPRYTAAVLKPIDKRAAERSRWTTELGLENSNRIIICREKE